MDVNDKQVAAERARQDLEDIMSLKNSDAFNRYFLRRLTQKRAEIERKFKYEPPEKVDKNQREELRQTMLALEDLEKMMSVDEGNIRGGISREAIAQRPRGGPPDPSAAPSTSAGPLG